MNQNFRFHLEKYHPGSKTTCPKCKYRKCFSHYIDEERQIDFPDFVGICDRQHKCGYHYSPKDYFRDYPEATEVTKATSSFEQPKFIPKHEEKKPSHIPREVMERSLAHYDMNPLFRFLERKFGTSECLRLFKRYHVGTSRMWGGATVYWQTDVKGVVRTGKVMSYDAATGHRVKGEGGSRISWAHSALHYQDFNLKQCLFGEHLLPSNPNKTVFLVESEKSALVASHYLPDYLWLATGGKTIGFHTGTLQVLRGRDVILLPNLGAEDTWREKLPMLKPICRSVVVSDLLTCRATEEQREEGLDIADFLLMEMTKEEILQDMISRYPALQILVDRLGLVIEED